MDVDHPMEEGTCSYTLRMDPIKLFTARYYAVCAIGGFVSAGTTHFLITPLDVLKVNMQIDPIKYNSIGSGFNILWREQGMPGLWRGWGGKLYGYGVQGGFKFGLYEFFKKSYCDMAGPGNIENRKTAIFMASSVSAQIFADVALCPFEAVKVRVQGQHAFAKGLVDGFPRIYSTEGILGLYRGLLPLWSRNLPFAMIMFSSFEHSVDFLYKNILHKNKSECSKGAQLGVTCVAGYMSGAIGTVLSNPADNIISSLYNKKVQTFYQAIRSIGLVGLFTRSLPLRFMIVGPVVTMQWFSYDAMKLLIGLPTSGGVDHHIGNAKARMSGRTE